MTEGGEPRLQVAVYWGAACGGCCVSVLDVHEGILDLLESVKFVFWPIVRDTKVADVEAMEDRAIDVCLFNGAVRNSENERMARLLREKSKFLLAYGACAQLGGVPGLANLHTRDEIFNRVYLEAESNDNERGALPERETPRPEGTLTLPEVYDDVRRLQDVVEVDYMIPGCPPQTERLVEVLTAVIQKDPLPPLGSVVGAEEKPLCDTCDREMSDKKLTREFLRPWEVEDDGTTCLLEQGILCMGPATRGGCGSRCISVNAPCRGCYGPTPEARDPGAGMLSAIATMIDSDDPETIRKVTERIVDPVGTFYRFSLPAAILRKAVKS